MPTEPSFWNFATTPFATFVFGAITTLGTVSGFWFFYLSKRQGRVHRYILDQAAKHLEHELAEEDVKIKNSEAARISEEIDDLRHQLEVEMPLEAKRTVLKDRLDGNIRLLEQTLNMTLDLQRQLQTLQTPTNIPAELLQAVHEEILPEYVQRERTERLKTYLIILLVVFSFTTSVVPGGFRLAVQAPLFMMGAFWLFQLVKTYSLTVIKSGDEETMRIVTFGLIVAGISTGTLAYFFMHDRVDDELSFVVAFISLLIGTTLATVAASIWRPNIFLRRITTSVIGVLALLFFFAAIGLLGDQVQRTRSRTYSSLERTTSIIVLEVLTAPFLASAWWMFTRWPSRRRPSVGSPS